MNYYLFSDYTLFLCQVNTETTCHGLSERAGHVGGREDKQVDG